MFRRLPIAKIQQELRTLFALALPIMVAQLASTAMGFVDTLMAGRAGAVDLAAVALGSSVWLPVYLLMNGILLATTARVARLAGAGRHAEVGPLVRQALWLALIIGLLTAGLLCLSTPLLHAMSVEQQLIAPTMNYLHGIALGMPAVALYQVLRCCSDGLGSTRPSMLFGVGGLLLNIPLNYLLIHGKFGLPALGGAGCGWASGIVMLCQCIGMFIWMARGRSYQGCQLFTRLDLPDWLTIRALLGTGLPIGIGIFAEASIFCVIALLVGELGATVVAGHQIALNLSSMIFMLPYSLGMATTVRVGQELGRGQMQAARFATIIAIGSALALAVITASLLLGNRERVAALYTSDPAVITLAAGLLIYSALFQLSDALQVTAAGALRGYQDTRATMLITLLAYWGVGLPLGYVLGLTSLLGQPSGPHGLWQGLVAGLTCAALLLALRLRSRSQRN